MRLRKPIANTKHLVLGGGTPAAISAARFLVIHGPMRAAPLWHARIGRWVTVVDRLIRRPSLAQRAYLGECGKPI